MTVCPNPIAPDAILLDMDGILFHGGHALPGAAEFLVAITEIPHYFVTNNPTRGPREVVGHFAELGLPIPRAEQIITSAQATAQWLNGQTPGFRYFAVGGQGLHEALAAVGKADDQSADFVVIGEGPGLDFDSLTTGINLILQRGAQLVCTNPDQNVDATFEGEHLVLPGGGALVAPFAVATGCDPVYIGKPHALLYRMALAHLGVGPAQCVMIGDRPDTGIAGAQAIGMRAALVRTGRFGPDETLPPGVSPDWDCSDLPALLTEWALV